MNLCRRHSPAAARRSQSIQNRPQGTVTHLPALGAPHAERADRLHLRLEGRHSPLACHGRLPCKGRLPLRPLPRLLRTPVLSRSSSVFQDPTRTNILAFKPLLHWLDASAPMQLLNTFPYYSTSRYPQPHGASSGRSTITSSPSLSTGISESTLLPGKSMYWSSIVRQAT